MTYYNTSFMDNVTGIYDIVEGVNSESGGWLIGVFLLTTWLLIWMVFRNKTDEEGAIIGSSFIISVVSGMFFVLELIPGWTIIFPLLGLIAGIVMKFMSK